MATNLTKLNVTKLNTRTVNVKECYDPNGDHLNKN